MDENKKMAQVPSGEKVVQEPVQNVSQNPEPVKKNNTILIIILIVLFLCFLLIVVFIGAGIWITKKAIDSANTVPEIAQKQIENEVKRYDNVYDTKDVAEDSVDTHKGNEEQGTMYFSSEYGFSLPMKSGWENVKIDENVYGGDFIIADVNFYLPSQYGNDEMQDYVQVFSISVYVTDSWNDQGEIEKEMAGEVVGTNEYYTLVYSHLNGEVLDITPQTMQNMQKIIDGIKVFSVNGDVDTADDSAYFTQEHFSDSHAAYRDNMIYYWNCNHRYSLYYPTTWSNNGMTDMSDEVQVYGDGINVHVKAYPYTGTLDEFAAMQKKKNGYSASTAVRDQMHGGAHVLAYSYEKSGVTVLYWREGKNVMEYKASGWSTKEESDVLTNMIATMQLNENNPHCMN
ncbi:MAG: hypothetical protein CR972_01140 [Candidatus Moraniibacteriota bacterium]|nr:MAG: hypothetical protein CR972_01140 [Candidatus Moranbacteria bacterium]